MLLLQNHLIKLIMLQEKKEVLQLTHVEYETANRHYSLTVQVTRIT
jgi:hypothetical protein